MHRFRHLTLFFLLAVAALAAELKIGTLNCYLLFDPRIDHRGKVDNEQRMSSDQYQQKLTNLANLLHGFNVVGLQETGGRAEISTLATRTGMSWCWERGNDTATGEEVGLIYKLPGWHVTSKGRVSELDKILSKHLLVEAKHSSFRALFLVVHLLRPMGDQVAKHKQQLSAVGAWMRRQNAEDPKAVVVILGDTNSTLTEVGSSLFGVGVEAGEKVGFKATHLTNKAYDRMVLLGPAKWQNVEIRKPPYGNRPPAPVKRVWTDHFLLGATLQIGSDSAPTKQSMGKTANPEAKITFDLSRLDGDGLTGPPDGKRELAYEFCIPARKECEEEVRSIDSTVQFQRGSRGRIGCGSDQCLCIGSTQQPGVRSVLLRLAALDYVVRIDECFFE